MLALTCVAAYSADLRYVIESVAGTNEVGDGGPAIEAQIAGAEGLAVDKLGNLYIADNLDHRIRRVSLTSGVIETVAGNGHPDLLDRPYGATFAGETLYIADFGNGLVRAIGRDGQIRIVAGSGSAGSHGGATSARLLGPRNVAADAAGNLYISDFMDHRVYKVSASGVIEIFAGTGNADFNGDGPATGTHLRSPAGLAVSRDGAVYIADSGNNRIRRVAGGAVATVLGGGVGGELLSGPTGVAVDSAGFLYVADSGNRRVLRLDPSGVVTELATAETGLGSARDVAVDASGRVYVAGGRRVYRLTGGELTAVAGCGEFAAVEEGALAVESYLHAPVGVAVDDYGAVSIAEESAYRVRKIYPDHRIRTLAGTGAQGFSGDGGLATAARLSDPVAVVTDTLGNAWIADYAGSRVRRVRSDGLIMTVAGTGTAGFRGDGGPAELAQLNRPRGLAVDDYGALYIADSRNHRVRKVDRSGLITTVAGSGVRGYSGELGLAIRAQLDTPAAVAVGNDGSLYIAEQGNHVIRVVRPGGFVFTAAGNGVRGYSGDGGDATAARLDSPTGVAVDSSGNLYIADTGNHRIRRVALTGRIETIAGDGNPGFAGDGGSARQARLRFPTAVAVDFRGRIFVADTGNRRVRLLVGGIPPDQIVEPEGESTVLHSASYRAGPFAPGQLVSVFGNGIGPAQLRINGMPAPVLWAGSDQLNAQIPYGVVGLDTAVVEVWVNDRLHSSSTLQIRPAAPGLFTLSGGTGQAIALNQDGSLNSPVNPAARGSVVVLYATGEGQTDPPGIEGAPAGMPLPRPVLPVEVRIGGLPAEILYAGCAPGFTGLMQINVRIPPGFIPAGNLRVELFIGGASSQPGVAIAVR